MKVRCPKCRGDQPLKATSLQEGLVAYRCEACDGKYLPSRNYLSWKEAQRGIVSDEESPNQELLPDDSINALICPECHRIMIKYVVGHGIRFKLDYCRSCNGVWLDKNEWEILESKNLHHEINLFFTESWQRKVRRTELNAHIERLFRQRIGEGNYQTVAEFRTWLDSTDFKAEILAYLQEEQSK